MEDKTKVDSGIHLFVRHVALVAHKHQVDALCGLLLNVADPILHVLERLLVRHVIDEQDALCSPVVGRGNSAETLLARLESKTDRYRGHGTQTQTQRTNRVPDLQLDALAIHLDSLDLEINAGRGALWITHNHNRSNIPNRCDEAGRE